MAWTAPKTWATATLTSSDLNTHLRDNLNETMPALAQQKGDLLIGDAANSLVRVAVGTDGFLLTADSGEASGWGWQDAGGVTRSQSFPLTGTLDELTGATDVNQRSTRFGNVMTFGHNQTKHNTAVFTGIVPYDYTAANLVRFGVVWHQGVAANDVVFYGTVNIVDLATKAVTSVFVPQTVTTLTNINQVEFFDMSSVGGSLVAGSFIQVRLTRPGDDVLDTENSTSMYSTHAILEYTN